LILLVTLIRIILTYILAIEHWENRSDHEAYMGWRAERGDVAKLMPFLAGPPEFNYYDILGD
jgi:quinol monooxygenase YgiN